MGNPGPRPRMAQTRGVNPTPSPDPPSSPLRRGRQFLRALPGPAAKLKARGLRLLARIHAARRPVHPFFQTLHALLEEDGDVSLRELLKAAGEQTYGLLILLLGLTSFIPGVSIVGGLALMVLGLQMAWGVPSPWLPERMQAFKLHRGKIKATLARLEVWLLRLENGPVARRPIHQRGLGLVVVWTAFLLALPVPVVFVGGNALPAAAVCLMGAALLEERPGWAWLGVLGSAGTTVYLFMSFDLLLKGLLHLVR